MSSGITQVALGPTGAEYLKHLLKEICTIFDVPKRDAQVISGTNGWECRFTVKLEHKQFRRARGQVAAGEPCAAQLQPLFHAPLGDRSERTAALNASRAAAHHALGEACRDGPGGHCQQTLDTQPTLNRRV